MSLTASQIEAYQNITVDRPTVLWWCLKAMMCRPNPLMHHRNLQAAIVDIGGPNYSATRTIQPRLVELKRFGMVTQHEVPGTWSVYYLTQKGVQVFLSGQAGKVLLTRASSTLNELGDMRSAAMANAKAEWTRYIERELRKRMDELMTGLSQRQTFVQEEDR